MLLILSFFSKYNFFGLGRRGQGTSLEQSPIFLAYYTACARHVYSFTCAQRCAETLELCRKLLQNLSCNCQALQKGLVHGTARKHPENIVVYHLQH